MMLSLRNLALMAVQLDGLKYIQSIEINKCSFIYGLSSYRPFRSFKKHYSIET